MLEYTSTVCAVAGVTIEIVWYVHCIFCLLSSSRGYEHNDKIGLTSMIVLFYTLIACGARSQIPIQIYFGIFLLQNFKFACCLGGFHLRITLNFLIYDLFIHIVCMPSLSKICPERLQALSNFIQFLSGDFLT